MLASLCVCLSLSLCLSICLSVCLSLFLSLCLSLFGCLSVCLSVSLCVCLSLFVYLSVCLSFCLSVCLSVFSPSVYLSQFSSSLSFSFTDPQYWLDYFPPLAKADLKSLGIRVSPCHQSIIKWSVCDIVHLCVQVHIRNYALIFNYCKRHMYSNLLIIRQVFEMCHIIANLLYERFLPAK